MERLVSQRAYAGAHNSNAQHLDMVRQSDQKHGRNSLFCGSSPSDMQTLSILESSGEQAPSQMSQI